MNSESAGAAIAPFAEHPAWQRLEDQLAWYDAKSARCQRRYKALKMIQLSLAVSVPVLAQVPAPTGKWLASIAGAAIALVEGVQQVNQYATLWVAYRATAEQLKREKAIFLAAAGPFGDLPIERRLQLLAERVEEHLSSEHANWLNENARRVTTGEKTKA